ILNQQKLTIIKRLHVKLHKLSLLILFFIAQSSMSMEITSLWQTLPIEIILHIAALTDNKASIAATNKQYCALITQKKMLKKYPQYLSSQDHMNFMVKYAKKNDADMIKFGLKTASLCGHDYLEMLSFVITKHSPLLDIIAIYKDNLHTEFPKKLIYPLMSFLRGYKTSIDSYKRSLKLDNQKDRARLTALHVAVNKQHLTFAQLFLAQDPTLLNQIPCYDRVPLSNNENLLVMATPLEVAIRRSCLPLCEYLLSFKNVKLDTSTENCTLLEWTAQYGSLDTLKLVTNRLKQQYSQKHYNSLLSVKALELVIRNKEKRLFLLNEMNYTLPGRKQPLHIAIEQNLTDLVKTICDHPNTDINAQDEDGNTPLFLTIDNNQKECINYLLNKGADSTISNHELQTTLHAAAISKNTNVIKLLLTTTTLKKYINHQDREGNTPLLCTIINTYHPIIEQSLNAEINPIMYAAHKNNIEVVKLLLHYGADPDIKNLDNKIAYDYTSSTEIKELLTKKKELL